MWLLHMEFPINQNIVMTHNYLIHMTSFLLYAIRYYTEVLEIV